MLNRFLLLIVVFWAAVLGGCARLDYVKVPTPTQYEAWTDAQQVNADKIEGVRYYLPRPFLCLKQPVPVAQRIAFVSYIFEKKTDAQGKTTEQGYYLQMPVNPPTWLKRLAPEKISVSQALAASLVSSKSESGGQGTGREEAEVAGVSTDSGTPAKDADNRPASELTARTGFINDSDPVTRLGEMMDVVYLPDFEEQYAIVPRSGIGKADIETRLRNGWAAEVFSQQVDNSNLVPYVIRQVESASQVAAGITTTWLPLAAGLPPGTAPAKLAEVAAAVTGKEEAAVASVKEADAVSILGQILIFKIAEVKIAQPGVYPILKPREIRYWMKTKTHADGWDPEDTFELSLKNNDLPWIRPDMAFIPAPPFTMVGFNVTTDAFLMPATGRLDVSPTGSKLPPKVDTSWEDDKKVLAKALAAKIAVSMPALDAKFQKQGGIYDVTVDKDREGASTKMTLRTNKPATKLMSAEKTEALFKGWIKATFNNIEEGQINVTFPVDTSVEITVSSPPGTLKKNVK